MPAPQIDINCDMGESYGNFSVGNDERIFPYITSCNIACGFHGGDPLHMENTIKKALKYDVQVGAHPSYPDLAGFGRREMQIPPSELRALVKYQIAALKGMTESLGGKLTYVKPHGALYNAAADDVQKTRAIVQAIAEIGSDIALLGLADSCMQAIAGQQGIPFIAEAFADRQYTAKRRLLSRNQPGAVIYDAQQAANQVLSIVLKKEAISNEGIAVPIIAQSICIHGDNPQAEAILQAIDKALKQKGILKKAF